MRMNTMQASKRVMRMLTRCENGESCQVGDNKRNLPTVRRGMGDGMRATGNVEQHGKSASAGEVTLKPAFREEEAGPERMTERSVVAMRSGNSGGAKGPWFKTTNEEVKTGDWR